MAMELARLQTVALPFFSAERGHLHAVDMVVNRDHLSADKSRIDTAGGIRNEKLLATERVQASQRKCGLLRRPALIEMSATC